MLFCLIPMFLSINNPEAIKEIKMEEALVQTSEAQESRSLTLLLMCLATAYIPWLSASTASQAAL